MRHFFTLSFLFFCLNLFSQIKTPAKFNYNVKSLKGSEKEVSITIVLEPSWHIYSQNPGKGPVATKVVFTQNPLIKIMGTTSELGAKIVTFDKAFNTKLSYYENKFVLTQRISKIGKIKTVLQGYVYYMLCDDSRCLPPTKEQFSISIP